MKLLRTSLMYGEYIVYGLFLSYLVIIDEQFSKATEYMGLVCGQKSSEMLYLSTFYDLVGRQFSKEKESIYVLCNKYSSIQLD